LLKKYEDKQKRWRSFSIPLRVIEDIYGSGNFDNASDDIVAALCEVSEYPCPFQIELDIDSTHQNPWFHVFIFKDTDIPDSIYEQFLNKLKQRGLLNE
jgi:hypothetical protein